uniref:Uncharacterized protein n=1 Tax=Lactuca sativa TaxID=4236 RepID=A0A9R1V0J4_LACSA|nr:hypothetical protein LSAT_V11C700377980 [Lactuca sativa]
MAKRSIIAYAFLLLLFVLAISVHGAFHKHEGKGCCFCYFDCDKKPPKDAKPVPCDVVPPRPKDGSPPKDVPPAEGGGSPPLADGSSTPPPAPSRH